MEFVQSFHVFVAKKSNKKKLNDDIVGFKETVHNILSQYYPQQIVCKLVEIWWYFPNEAIAGNYGVWKKN